jgi:GTP-binding protein HflX
MIESRLRQTLFALTYRLPHEQGAAGAWLYQHGDVQERRDESDYYELTVRLSPEDSERFERRFGVAPVQDVNEEARQGHG